MFFVVHSVISHLWVKDVLKCQRLLFQDLFSVRQITYYFTPPIGIGIFLIEDFSIGWSSYYFHGNVLFLVGDTCTFL